MRSIVAVALIGGALAAPAVAGASSGPEFEGHVRSVDRAHHTFKLRGEHGSLVRFKVTRATRFERLSGFSALHRGVRVEVKARRSGGRWVARKIEREAGREREVEREVEHGIERR